MVSPSLCGGFLTNKKSMVAFTWAITTAMTLFAFIAAIFLVIEISAHYRRMERYYDTDDWITKYQYSQQNNGNGNDDGNDEKEQSFDEQEAYDLQSQHLLLATMSTQSIAWIAFYVMFLATGLALYGSTAIIGFTSLRGVYIAPCFSSGSDKLRLGIFGGSVVLFANILLVCAIILGEVRVDDNRDRDRDQQQNGDDSEPYRVERIAGVLAVTSMFLAGLYTIFAVLLFLCYAGEDEISSVANGEGRRPGNKTPLVSVNDGRQGPELDSPGFLTMDNSSQTSSRSRTSSRRGDD